MQASGRNCIRPKALSPMNKVIQAAGILLLFLAGITACNKPADDKVRDIGRLRIVRIKQSTVREPQKVNLTDFIYDDQHRVKRIAYSYEETVNGILTTHPGNSLTYHYSDNTLKNPYRASGQVSNGWVADIYYTYNNAGKLIRDSAVNAGATEVRTHDYTYASGKIIVTRGNYYQSNGTIAGSTLLDSVVIKDNNIIEVVYGTGAAAGTGSRFYYQLFYDTRINPMSKLNIAAVKIVEGLQTFPDILAPGICSNNITSYAAGYLNSQGERTQQAIQSYSFTYTKEGLPETCTITNQLETYTLKYTYEEF